MLSLLRRLLADLPPPIHAGDVGEWWRHFVARRSPHAEPIDDAIMAGAGADRVGYAFAGAYEAALRALFPAMPEGEIASFCATERGGNTPRAIDTRLAPRADGGVVLTGAKRWSTLGPLASVLLVVAAEGVDDDGRKRLRVARVSARARGVAVVSMPLTPFVPEIPHAAIDFDAVEIEAGALLPGDGYTRYVKPFRTVEDIHIHAALLAYVISVARRHDLPLALVERAAAALVATRALAAQEPSAPDTHVALAGLLADASRLFDDVTAAWTTAHDAEQERWVRDRALVGITGDVRERRRRRAWELLGRQP
ncbi:MAG TPA: acyl-CoA dehydrogenase family protein [Methylomirabilota bacterium]|jgi:alkylation response protein AidB-like acyl-CoA dehydrogenase